MHPRYFDVAIQSLVFSSSRLTVYQLRWSSLRNDTPIRVRTVISPVDVDIFSLGLEAGNSTDHSSYCLNPHQNERGLDNYTSFLDRLEL